MAIFNLGSLNYDRVYDVEHFVKPEEIVSASGYDVFFGGKGLNQSIAAVRSGAKVFHIGAVGEDGDPLLEVLESNGIDARLVKKVDSPSGHAIIQSCREQNCIIVYKGANHRITQTQIDGAFSLASSGDILLLQNETSYVSYALALEYISLAAGLAVTKKGAVNSIPTRQETENFKKQVSEKEAKEDDGIL